MALTAQQVADKWRRRLEGASEDYRRGIEAVTESPTEAAAKKKDKMLAGITAAVNSGKWERGLRRVTLADWKQQTIEKGVSRLAAGAAAGQGKMQTFMEDLLPYQQALTAKIDSMPDVTFEDGINRMVAFARGMRDFKRS